ncbi:MAG TPA: hypothetical protein VKU00_09505 [Chthonomonadaceae bacterium]|nr:hypothetical protein [Chthonomonadaceae bacterium]
MKQEVTPIVWGVVIVVAVLFLGFVCWKCFGPHGDTVDQATIDARIAAKKAHLSPPPQPH